MPEDLDNSEEKRDRLWNYLLHVETQIYTRMTLFLVIETLLLATVGTFDSKPAPSLLVVKAIDILGLCITIIWFLLGHRVKQVFEVVDEQAQHLPVYEEFLDTLKKTKPAILPLRLFRGHAPSIAILTYVIPALFALLWIFLLFFL
jgi:hypothetical protein